MLYNVITIAQHGSEDDRKKFIKDLKRKIKLNEVDRKKRIGYKFSGKSAKK